MDALVLARQLALGVLRRRKGLLLLAGVLAMVVYLPAAYYVSKEPPRFRTSASLILESKPSAQMALFQELMPARPVAIQMAILKSRTLAESVIENLPKSSIQDLLENPYYIDYQLAMKNQYRRLVGVEPEVESPQRRVLKELQQARVSFGSGADGLVYISAEASKPQVAVDIVNTYVDALLSRTRSVNMEDARVSREFLETQVSDVKKNLRTAEDALRQFTAAHGGVKIPERAQAAVSQLALVENAVGEVEANRKMIQTRLKAFREKADKLKADAPSGAVRDPKDDVRRAAAQAMPAGSPRGAAGMAAAAAGTGPASPAVSTEVARLREVLTVLERGLVDLRLKYTDEHPAVARTKERIADVQTQLADAVKDAIPQASVTAAAGAVPAAERTLFAEQFVALETALQTVTAQEDALRKQAETIRQGLKGLTQSESEYTRLVREVESSRGLSTMLSDKLTGARIREQGEMKVVKVIDPAGFPQPATGEKRLKFMAAALLLAMLTGLAIPAGVEWIRKTVDSEEDVKRSTGLAVLAVLPRVKSLPLGGDVAHAARARSLGARLVGAPWRAARVIAPLAWRALAWSCGPLAALARLTWRYAGGPVMAIGRVLRPAGRPFAVAARWIARPIARILPRRRRMPVVAGMPAVDRSRLRATLARILSRRGVLAILPGGRRRAHAYAGADHGEMADIGASFMFGDALRRLQVAVQFAARSERLRTILVTSAYPNEGKSTLVANLGHAFREAGVSAVMVDADFHRPTLHRVASVEQQAGVVDALHDGATIERALVPLGGDLWLVPRGAELTSRSRAALASGRLNDMMRELGERTDIVLCDSAPVLLVPENLFLAAAADGVILVAKAGITTCADLASAKATLDDVGARVLGVVINEMPLSVIKGHYKRYYKAYMRSEIA